MIVVNAVIRAIMLNFFFNVGSSFLGRLYVVHTGESERCGGSKCALLL